jgi:hypothetical protein
MSPHLTHPHRLTRGPAPGRSGRGRGPALAVSFLAAVALALAVFHRNRSPPHTPPPRLPAFHLSRL